ncbi:hypothetical protein MUO65_01970 [bacterium]|nr:hypothetical protein [bacterium]
MFSKTVKLTTVFLTLLTVIGSIWINAMASEIVVLIGDRDRYDQGLPPCIGPNCADINILSNCANPFYNATDCVMNANYAFTYFFQYSLPPSECADSAFIIINSLDVEPMGDSGTTPYYPSLDGVQLSQALHSVPHPWGSPGQSDLYTTETVFNLDQAKDKLNDGQAIFQFPAGTEGDNVAFDFVELHIFTSASCSIPYKMGDANCDTKISVSDVVYLINYLFKGGSEPCPSCVSITCPCLK